MPSLAAQTPPAKPPPPAVIIGPGRVGRAIARFYSSNSTQPPALLLGRDQRVPAWHCPVWLCCTNDSLSEVLRTAAAQQRQQLIFVQNGMLLPLLRQHGLEHSTTQVLLYMSATEDGTVTDGKRTAVCGPWAQHVSATLQANGVACSVIHEWPVFNQLMLVKLLWASIFWLLSAGLGGKPVGQVAAEHQHEVAELVAELLPLGQAYLSSSNSSSSSSPCLSEAKVLDQLLSYSLAIPAAVPSVEMARREFSWRNGFFLSQGHTPRHCEWLARAGCADLLLAGGGVCEQAGG